MLHGNWLPFILDSAHFFSYPLTGFCVELTTSNMVCEVKKLSSLFMMFNQSIILLPAVLCLKVDYVNDTAVTDLTRLSLMNEALFLMEEHIHMH